MLSSLLARSEFPFRSPKSYNSFRFQPLAAPSAPPKKSTPLESSKSSLFLQNTRVGGTPSFLFFRISEFQPLFSRSVATVATGFSKIAFRSFSVLSVPAPAPTWSGWQIPSFQVATRLPRSSRGHSPLPLVTPFGINTCKSVTKQATLTIFIINTYAKTGGGGVPPILQFCTYSSLCLGVSACPDLVGVANPSYRFLLLATRHSFTPSEAEGPLLLCFSFFGGSRLADP